MDFVQFVNSRAPFHEKQARGWGALGSLAPRLLSAVGGGYAGSDLGAPGNVNVPLLGRFNLPGAVAGFAAGGRGRASGMMHPLRSAVQRASLGGLIGHGADAALGTDNFGRVGASVGLASAAPSLLRNRYASRLANSGFGQRMGLPALQRSLVRFDTRAARQVNDAFQNSSHYLRRPVDWFMRQPTPVRVNGVLQPTGTLSPLSRIAAIGTAAGALAPPVYAIGANRIQGLMDTAQENINQRLGYSMDAMRNYANDYIEQELPERLSGAVGNAIRGSGSNMLSSMGINTGNMSPWQQWALMGGGGVGLLGLLTGNNTLATMGGGAMAASFLPQLLQMWQAYQQRQQQQQAQQPGAPVNAASGTLPTAPVAAAQ